MTTNTKKHIICGASGLTALSGVSYTGAFATTLLSSVHRLIPGPWGEIGALVIDVTGYAGTYVASMKAGEAVSCFVAELIDDEEWLKIFKE